MKKIILNKKEKILELIIISLLVFMGASLRLLPHSPNFTPILAIALFGGFYFSKRTAFILPLLAMVIPDIVIGYYEAILMAFVYGSFLLCVVLGIWLKKHKNWYTVLGSSILGATLFFLITNFAVWAFTPWYAKTFSGIIQCYFMALPFFKNALLGDLLYVSLFFGSYEIISLLAKEKFFLIRKKPVFPN